MLLIGQDFLPGRIQYSCRGNAVVVNNGVSTLVFNETQ